MYPGMFGNYTPTQEKAPDLGQKSRRAEYLAAFETLKDKRWSTIHHELLGDMLRRDWVYEHKKPAGYTISTLGNRVHEILGGGT